MKQTVLCGADVFAAKNAISPGMRIGLITNPTGVLRDMTSTADFLRANYNLCALFAPEHGIRGDVQAGASVEGYIDPRTALPVYSTYGAGRSEAERMMGTLDAVIFDIQDVGARFYTYLYTMTQSMQACAASGTPFIVLDRANPLSGKIEGSILRREFASFVGKYPVATRTGLTIGEFAVYINAVEHLNCDLTVIPCKGWSRSLYYDDTDLCWIAPSPNLPTIDSALAYIGTCLFEGTNLSEGRGTTKPFELFGAPWLDTSTLKSTLDDAPHPGCLLRETYFTPTFSKYANERCAGLQIHITNRDTFAPFPLALQIIASICNLHPQFQLTPSINHLLGSDAIWSTTFIPSTFLQKETPLLQSYKDEVKKYYIY